MINNLYFFLKNKSPKIVIFLYLYNKLINIFFKNKKKIFKKKHKNYLLNKKLLTIIFRCMLLTSLNVYLILIKILNI